MGLTRAAAGPGAADTAPSIRRERPEDRIIALAGNPNVGKSTVFNALTGLRQHTGNWPGKTVATAQGRCTHSGRGYVLVDLPGTYSLLARSAEEEVTRAFLCAGGADGAVVVCDATCLERNLILALQVIELIPRTVVCVNLLDEAARRGVRVDLETLSRRLGVPVAGASAGRGEGLDGLLEAVERTVSAPEPPTPAEVRYPPPVEFAAASLRPLLEARLDGRMPARWLALRLLEGDDARLDGLAAGLGWDPRTDKAVGPALEKARAGLARAGLPQAELGDRLSAAAVEQAADIAAQVTAAPEGAAAGGRLDRLLTSRAAAIPLMLLLLAGVLWLTIAGANLPSQLLAGGLFWVQDRLTELFTLLNAPDWLHGALVLGVYRVLAWVVSVMLPPMAIFFPLFTLLEDLGYLPRVAFVLDHAFQKARACGKQALTMCMGLGCNAAGVVGCRIIDSPRERLIAVLTNSLVPCNGRFPPPGKGQTAPRQQGLQHLQPRLRVRRRRQLHQNPPGPVFGHRLRLLSPTGYAPRGAKSPRPAVRRAGGSPFRMRSDHWLLHGKPLRRPAGGPIHQPGEPPHNSLRLLPHLPGKPAQHHAGDGVHEEVGEEFPVLPGQGQPAGRRLQVGGHHGPGHPADLSLQILPPAGAVDVVDHQMVVLGVAEHGQQGVLPARRPLQGALRLMLQEPAQQVVDVLEVVIEGLAVDLARLHQPLHRNVVQEPLLQLGFQRVCQSQLGAGGHPPHLLRKISYKAVRGYYITLRRPIAIPGKVCYDFKSEPQRRGTDMTINYRPRGVCSQQMTVEIEDGVIQSFQVKGGCDGNLQGISRLVEGMRVDDAIRRLDGIHCGFKSTSCPDQLAQALKQYEGE